jgi:hypothetical protein
MNILENYAACCLTPVLFDINAAGCIPNPPKCIFYEITEIVGLR